MNSPAQRDPLPERAVGRFGTVVLCVDTPWQPPARVDAELFEQDTCFVLAARGPMQASRESYEHLVQGMIEQRGVTPGTVIVRERTRPVRIEAIVHDLDCEPSWRAEWIEAALCEAFASLGRRSLRSLRTPVLGRVHGRLTHAAFARLLLNALACGGGDHLSVVWIRAAQHELADLIAALRAALARHPGGCAVIFDKYNILC